MTTPRALLVHAHPEPSSFCTAQAASAVEELTAAGFAVDRIDLYRRSWDPVLDRGEFGGFDGPFKPQAEQLRAVREGTLDAEVRVDLDRLLAADLLILSFPLWWFSLPAILKGWIDRVFVMGAAFGGDHGLFEHGALAGKRAVLLVTTGGSEAAFNRGGEFGDIEDFLFHVRRGMLEFVGYEVLPSVITYGPAHANARERDAALASVRAGLKAVAAFEDSVPGSGIA